MAHTFPHLLWIRTFDACARHLGFARAADELGLTPAAVGQHIKQLEAQLGFQLFERLPRGIRLTTLGRAYAPIVGGLLTDLSAGTAALFGVRGVRSVTLRCVASFASLRLPRILGAFVAAYPEISVKVQTSVWNDDLDASHVDLEVRYGNGLWPDHDVMPIAEGLSYPLCPPGSSFGQDPGGALFAMASAAPIQILGMEPLWRKLGQQLGWPEHDFPARCTVDTSAIALELVANGVGCAIIDAELCRLHLERGLVTRPPGITVYHQQRHYVLVPRTDQATRPEVLILRDFLRSQLRAPAARAHA